ncbi:NifU N-terminal domain-containing protein [Phycisphaerales bacterium AB-hyl4]|uniref:NifU N-terminal domain-containing protein n=1 Tax=Natronomicrosphaera hydrolytica TaxID=3242702 RepID=A0ABV4U0F8_9BACT
MFGRLKITVEETPNPNARKFNLNCAVTNGERRSYTHVDQAAGDELALQLFAIEHVVGVMLLGDFCTVNKSDAGRWTTLSPKVRRVLKAAMKQKV